MKNNEYLKRKCKIPKLNTKFVYKHLIKQDNYLKNKNKILMNKNPYKLNFKTNQLN